MRPSWKMHCLTTAKREGETQLLSITAVRLTHPLCKWEANCIDVFGPLGRCSNCEKTKKGCTFEWLRSQRVLQSKDQPENSVPPSKRRRTSLTKSSSQNETCRQVYGVDPGSPFPPITSRHSTQRDAPLNLGVTFADFPGMFDNDPCSTLSGTESPISVNQGTDFYAHYIKTVVEDYEIVPNRDSGKGSSLETTSEGYDDGTGNESGDMSSTKTVRESIGPKNETTTHISRKRRRHESPISILSGALPCPSVSLTSDLVLSTNNAYLTDGLLRIYHNSFEGALSCWATERTCLSSTKADVSVINEARPDWNRIYHRMFRLDRLSTSIRGRQLTFTEDKAASKALNFAIYSFATQWAQPSVGSQVRYPFDRTATSETGIRVDRPRRTEPVVDRVVQINAWHEAHNALQAAGGIESFRVALAQIIFSLTQKPVDNLPANKKADEEHVVLNSDQETEKLDIDQELDECEDLLSQLDLAIDADGPRRHLEQGLRLIHSLRSRMTMCNEKPRRKAGSSRCRKQHHSSSGRLDNADRAVVDLLFWLGVMFDTLSSAMNKRPLVVSDEDSNIYPDDTKPIATDSGEAVETVKSEDGTWDGHLFARQDSPLQKNPLRWPCSFDQAAALICDAAPVKVLLFRKVTRIQTLLTRDIRGTKVEASLSAALEVHAHWERSYAPFLRDCVRYHNQLHPRIQSWYTCLAGHWHLATFLLADLIETIDESKLGLDEASRQRISDEFLACFRDDNCRMVSEMAKCACPRDDALFSQSHDVHFALNQGSLLIEPWTVVIIRVFAKAGVVLLESDTMLPSNSTADSDDYFQRADDCVRALWYLGRKSDIALSAAKILGNALRERRKGVQEQDNASSPLLDVELWHGFEGFEAAFEVDCES